MVGPVADRGPDPVRGRIDFDSLYIACGSITRASPRVVDLWGRLRLHPLPVPLSSGAAPPGFGPGFPRVYGRASYRVRRRGTKREPIRGRCLFLRGEPGSGPSCFVLAPHAGRRHAGALTLSASTCPPGASMSVSSVPVNPSATTIAIFHGLAILAGISGASDARQHGETRPQPCVSAGVSW
jgi:hypothetical protein